MLKLSKHEAATTRPLSQRERVRVRENKRLRENQRDSEGHRAGEGPSATLGMTIETATTP